MKDMHHTNLVRISRGLFSKDITTAPIRILGGMKCIAVFLTLILIPGFVSAQAGDRMVLAEDDASDPLYKEGWKEEGGGTGLGAWTFQSLKTERTQSHAGFFIAETARNSDLNGIAIRGRAFGLFANGVGFEIASAFRPLKKPLMVGQTFSFLIEHAGIVKKFEQDDPATGSIGIVLRAGNAKDSVEDYNKGARFEFGCYEGKGTYQIYDGEPAGDTAIPLTDAGLSVSFTLVTPDTYDLEITTLSDKKTTTLKGRKLGGEAGTKVGSVCIFDRDGEKSDAFFNGFQITGERE